jgi:hypothetical protein
MKRVAFGVALCALWMLPPVVAAPPQFVDTAWMSIANMSAFEAGVPKRYADTILEEFLKSSATRVIRPNQYMNKWRLDGAEVKKALGFN